MMDTHWPSIASTRNRRIRRAASIAASFGLALAFQSPQATAHEAAVPIEASKVALKVGGGGNGAKNKLSFKAKDDAIATGLANPAEDGAALLLVAGDGSGRTQLIDLDRGKWKSSKSGTVYKYKDPSGSRGGVRKIVFKDGSLTIKASGAALHWAGSMDLSSLWVLFRVEQEWHCALTSGATKTKKDGQTYAAKASSRPAACPQPVCGNGSAEAGEECDDGDVDDADACTNDCRGVSTFDAIQRVIFDSPVYGCTNAACHSGANPGGGLDLTAGNSFASLLGEDGKGAAATNAVGERVRRVVPGEPDQSFLYDKLARRTLPDDGPYLQGGTDMPSGTAKLTESHLEAIYAWIRGGASEDAVVPGTAELLGTELPDPRPLKITPPDPPGAGVGVQFQQTPWALPGEFENEICMATYYDLTQTNLVPDWAKVECPEQFRYKPPSCVRDANIACTTDADCGTSGPCAPAKNVLNKDNQCFAWRRQVLVQDPQSHHSIIHIYTGGFDQAHTGWGSWTYKLDQDPGGINGQPCDPADVDPALGYDPGCSGGIVPEVACIGFGPPDYSEFSPQALAGAGGSNSPMFSGSQEPYYEQTLAPGVYTVLPMRGVIAWNSHAFNLTKFPTTMNQFLNVDFADPPNQLYPVRQIFNSSQIFVQNVPPFESREYCSTHTLPEGAHLFQLTSHTHRFGVQFRIWGSPNERCTPASPKCQPKGPEQLIYRSTEYADPLQLEGHPLPFVAASSAPEDRTFLYCSLYDNGSTPESPEVKRQSTSPPLKGFAGAIDPFLNLGGPCEDAETACLDGPSKGVPCNGDDAACPGSVCDACPLRGGVTTEDEMFIMLGLFYVPN